MAITKSVEYIKKFIIDTLFPVKCSGCGVKNEIFCDNCVAKARLAERETDRDIIALFDYRDTIIKNAIWELKYHKKRYLGERLGEILYENLMEEISNIKSGFIDRAIIIIPVPISKNKKRSRGYNQAFHIAKGFCMKENRKIFELRNDIVYRKVDAPPQARITNRKRRLENVRGIFSIKNEKDIKGRTIIVIDDVTTTGGTINEISKVLKKSGAKKVIGLTLAH